MYYLKTEKDRPNIIILEYDAAYLCKAYKCKNGIEIDTICKTNKIM